MKLNPKQVQHFENVLKKWEDLKSHPDTEHMQSFMKDLESAYNEFKNIV